MKKRNILLAFLIVELALLVMINAFGWFSDRSTPSISQNDIKVSSAEGLVLKLSPDSAARTNINLNEIVNDFSLFELQQMSTSDAINFYTIDFGAGLSYGNPSYVAISPDATTSLINSSYGCIDYDFYLQTESYAKLVYFHKDTAFTGIAWDSLRFSITVDDPAYNFLKIFGSTKEDGTTNFPYTTKAVIAPGSFVFSTGGSASQIGTQNVHLINEYDGGRSANDANPIDPNKVLFAIPANTIVKMNLKIWLEGGDPECNNTLSAETIDALLKFGSANVLRDAPAVYAYNATVTITNLDTTMEYAYDYTANTTWTTVTNPSMVFQRGDTVYVRYKEVTGVSLASYATVVQFN